MLLGVQQVIPLPEAEEYQVRIRDKTRQKKASLTQERDLTKYDITVAGTKYPHLPKRPRRELRPVLIDDPPIRPGPSP